MLTLAQSTYSLCLYLFHSHVYNRFGFFAFSVLKCGCVCWSNCFSTFLTFFRDTFAAIYFLSYFQTLLCELFTHFKLICSHYLHIHCRISFFCLLSICQNHIFYFFWVYYSAKLVDIYFSSYYICLLS